MFYTPPYIKIFDALKSVIFYNNKDLFDEEIEGFFATITLDEHLYRRLVLDKWEWRRSHANTIQWYDSAGYFAASSDSKIPRIT